MNYLFIIPARGNSKGIHKKNIKLLNGKPLICYSIDVARKFVKDEDICVSTDDDEIKQITENYHLPVPFIRPAGLATDEAGTHEVLTHAVNHYEAAGKKYEAVVLLQPTSPLRVAREVSDAIKMFNKELDMVVSVRESHAAGLICHENEWGYLEETINLNATRRQEVKGFYEYNGAIYIINVESLKAMHMSEFKKIKKYVMPPEHSIDIDSYLDWKLAEIIIDNEFKQSFHENK